MLIKTSQIKYKKHIFMKKSIYPKNTYNKFIHKLAKTGKKKFNSKYKYNC